MFRRFKGLLDRSMLCMNWTTLRGLRIGLWAMGYRAGGAGNGQCLPSSVV
jgi:hypothetical protein